MNQDTNSAQNRETDESSQSIRVRRRKQHSPRWRRWINKRFSLRAKRSNLLIIIATVLVVGVVGSIALVTDGVNRVRASAANLSRVADGFTGKPGTELTLSDFDRLQASVNELISSLDTARQRLVVMQPFRSLNGDADATLVTLDAADNLAQAAKAMLEGLQPTLFFMVSGDQRVNVVTQISSGERIVELLQLGQGKFGQASTSLLAAQSSLTTTALTNLSQDSILNILGLVKYHDQLEQINNLLLQAPNLLTAALGLDIPRNYLILSQNSDELRPSGGYISTWGWMNVNNARVTSYGYSPTTATSPKPPPAEFASEIQIPSWWLSYNQPIYAAFDGSWYADFPSTADMAMRYYNDGNNDFAPVDGVLAIDITGFEYILTALGTVVVPEYNEVVTAGDFRSVVYDIRAFGEGDLPHKRFLSALYKQIFADWQSAGGDPEVNSRLLGAVLQALQEKHIMLYFADGQLNQAIDLLNWSGHQLPATNHDYLMVADANLGNKSNHSINRQLIYDVDIQPDGTLHSRATIAYDYPARVAEQDPAVNPEHHGPLNYGNLMQIFVPLGSQITGSDNFLSGLQTENSEAYTEFIAQVFVDYDTNERFQVSYAGAPLVESFGPYQRYRLLLQKQPGTLNNNVTVQVTLPDGAALISASPMPATSYSFDRQILEFQFNLATDHWLEVVYRH